MVTDEEIVSLVQKGNKEQFGELIKRYEKKLYRFLRGMTNERPEETEDLLQEVFLAGYENMMGFDKGRKFSSWIYRIAHNKAVDRFKKHKEILIDMSEKEEVWQSREKLIEELEVERSNQEAVKTAVERLELNYKEVVLLYYFEEKSYEEIAEILRIPTTNVGVLLYRAKVKLKKILEVRF